MPEVNELKRNKHGTKYIWHPCINCGKERWVAVVHGKPERLRCKSCAAKLQGRGQGARGWKGGRWEDRYGYILVYIQPDNFFYRMRSNGNYIREHRLVMAKHLNRCLLPWEIVHHKNSIKNDNRLENLELLPAAYQHNVMSKLGTYIKHLEIENQELKQRIAELKEEIPQSRR